MSRLFLSCNIEGGNGRAGSRHRSAQVCVRVQSLAPTADDFVTARTEDELKSRGISVTAAVLIVIRRA
eukprot:COSAG01_NODE_880_length_12937_cov_265.873968_11_plen_68_part_00